MIANLTNTLYQHGQSNDTGPRTGTISSYDPDSGVVKVLIQPEGRETNWMPLDCPGVGNGWGFQIGPQIGDEVTVSFDSSDPNLGKVTARHTNSQNQPMPVPAGEIWAVHQSGSLLKFHNDGTVTLHSGVSINYDAPQHNFTGGPVAMDHKLTVTDAAGIEVVGGDVLADTISLKQHIHTGGTISGNTGMPTP